MHEQTFADSSATTTTTTGRHLLILDIWRGGAITLLLIGHFWNVPKINCGRLGVEFFFVLSGFLMGKLLFVKHTPLSRFYQRRVSRIFPTAYLFLTTMIVIGLAFPKLWKPNFPGAISCFLFYMNYYVAIFGISADVGLPTDHFWSLCVEEHSYIYLSLLSVIHRRTGKSAVGLLVASFALCFALSVFIGFREHWDYYRVYWRSDCRAGSIFCGAIVAVLSAQGVGSRSSYGRIRSDVLGVLFVLAGIILNFNKIPDLLKFSLGSIALAVGLLLVSQHFQGDRPWSRPLVWLGTISYSIYLWQQPFYHAKNRGDLGGFLALTLAILVGVISYFVVERPVRDWLNTTWSPPTKVPGA